MDLDKSNNSFDAYNSKLADKTPADNHIKLKKA